MKKQRVFASAIFLASTAGLFFLSPSLEVDEEPEAPPMENRKGPSPEGSPGSSENVDTIMIGDFEYGDKS